MTRGNYLSYGLAVDAVLAALMCAVIPAQAADKKPNILVIWGDDIGIHNISAYSLGVMGCKTPNIDRIATWSDGKGGQKVEDTGPLTQARMPTVDLEIYAAEQQFVDKAVKDGKPYEEECPATIITVYVLTLDDSLLSMVLRPLAC